VRQRDERDEEDAMKDRFQRLAALTRGAAIVAAGVGGTYAVACTKSEPSPQPTLAAAGSAQADLTDPVDASDGDASPRFRHRFPIPNAMRPDWRFRDAGPSGGGADGSSGP
jgi:hypothetical protein